MVNVVAKMCASNKCRKQPSYGVTGTVKPKYCAAHALKGMVSIVRKRCAQNGCFKLPSYGVTETKKREYCAEHAAEWMVNVASKKRANDGCYGASRMPHSMAGNRKPETCDRQAVEAMASVGARTCAKDGCSKQRAYGKANLKKQSTAPNMLLAAWLTLLQRNMPAVKAM